MRLIVVDVRRVMVEVADRDTLGGKGLALSASPSIPGFCTPLFAVSPFSSVYKPPF